MDNKRLAEILELVWMRDWSSDDAYAEIQPAMDDLRDQIKEYQRQIRDGELVPSHQ